MAHNDLPEGLPGITGPLNRYPETARHLRGLAETLLRGPSSLTPDEREGAPPTPVMPFQIPHAGLASTLEITCFQQ